MITDTLGLVEKIVTEIRNNVDLAVIGLSGGADSTLVACLCVKALGKDNVYGVHMPFGEYDKNTFNKKSVIFANHIGIKQQTIDIKESFLNLKDQVSLDIDRMTEGNTRARLRMSSLYMVAGILNTTTNKRVRVMNTCNTSETKIGYESKFGDGAGDLSPIGKFYKSEVYQLLDFFKNEEIITEDMIDRVPSAGLWPSQTDESELGYSYNEMEPFVRLIDSALRPTKFLNKKDEEIFNFVLKKYLANEHKMKPMPVIEIREFCD